MRIWERFTEYIIVVKNCRTKTKIIKNREKYLKKKEKEHNWVLRNKEKRIMGKHLHNIHFFCRSITKNNIIKECKNEGFPSQNDPLLSVASL